MTELPMQENNLVIECTNLNKIYYTYPTPRHRLLEIITGGRKSYSQETRALDDVSFTLQRGGRLGIVGENGSGKSTLLKVLAGVLTPTSGTVNVRGRVSALLELGAGFNPELPGRENIRQFCMLHGMQRDEIEEALPDIITFSELRESVEHPVKTYSSGMSMRLGFACAVYVQPDILIVDEALSVGDAYFQNKCLHKIRSMLDEGPTFIYVTHAADSIRSLCEEGLWLENGKVCMLGKSMDVGAAYQKEIFSRMVRSGLEEQTIDNTADICEQVKNLPAKKMKVDKGRQQAFAERVGPLRTGSGEILIDDIVVITDSGEETDSIEFDADVCIRVFFHCNKKVSEDCSLTIGIVDNRGNQLLHFNSGINDIYPSDIPCNIQHMLELRFRSFLCPGEYGIIAGICILTKHPKNNCQTIIGRIIDSCAGGTRFSVCFPMTEMDKDLWGVMYVDSEMSMYSLG
jgi:lipopolysaccharide transport system ATP-binding protein